MNLMLSKYDILYLCQVQKIIIFVFADPKEFFFECKDLSYCICLTRVNKEFSFVVRQSVKNHEKKQSF